MQERNGFIRFPHRYRTYRTEVRRTRETRASGLRLRATASGFRIFLELQGFVAGLLRCGIPIRGPTAACVGPVAMRP